jgi:hypothetical protein
LQEFAKELGDAHSLGVSDVLAIDDDGAIAKFRLVDAIADTVGGDVATKLIVKIKSGGFFGYTSVLPESAAALNPAAKIKRVLAQPPPFRYDLDSRRRRRPSRAFAKSARRLWVFSFPAANGAEALHWSERQRGQSTL